MANAVLGWLLAAVAALLRSALAVRSLQREPCSLEEQAIRIEYSEPGSLNQGEFDLVKISSWNGNRIVTKSYGGCKVDYSVTCIGTSVSLVLEDSCGTRSDTRPISKYRTTELHTSSFTFSHLLRDPDKEIELHLPIKKRLVMHADGSTVTFRRIEPLPLEEQLKNPSQLRFFASVPRLASCLPEPGDHIFRPQRNTTSFSAEKCSACYNFLESSLKDMKQCSTAETTASRIRCKQFAARVKQEDEGVQSTLKKSMEHRGNDVTMELAWQLGCQDLGCCPLDPDTAELLAAQATSIHAREKYGEAARGRRHEEVGKLKQEGLAEHVLNDPDTRQHLETLMRMQAGHARKQLKKEKSRKQLKKDPDEADSAPAHAQVPLTDEDCSWNFRKARCEPKYACAYKYRFGDLKIKQSCRLTVKKFRPTRNEDCLWDYAEVRCKNPLYCSRQCKLSSGDLNLDMCCKLRKKALDETADDWTPIDSSTTTFTTSIFGGTAAITREEDEDVDDEIGLMADAENEDEYDSFLNDVVNSIYEDKEIGLEADPEWTTKADQNGDDIGLEADTIEPDSDDGNAGEKDGEAEGLCTGQSDRDALKGSKVPELLEKIGRESWSTWKFKIVRETSLKLHKEKLGLSELCATCFVDVSDCSTKQCFSLLAAKGKEHPESQACIEEHCSPALLQCAGLPKEEHLA